MAVHPKTWHGINPGEIRAPHHSVGSGKSRRADMYVHDRAMNAMIYKSARGLNSREPRCCECQTNC